MNISHQNNKGFTLIELVTVIIILGVLATSVTAFLRFGTQSYTNAVDREALTSTARFVIERLNREVRHALPNSARLTGTVSKRCLEFTPIAESVVYLDVPVLPELAKDTLTLAPFASSSLRNSSKVSVYATNSNDIYGVNNGVTASFDASDISVLTPLYSESDIDDESTAVILKLENAVQFDADSPTNRLYFLESSITYCLESGSLYRYSNYTNSETDDSPVEVDDRRVLMAEYIANRAGEQPFKITEASLQRNAIVSVWLRFNRNLEEIVFSNEIQVPNVP